MGQTAQKSERQAKMRIRTKDRWDELSTSSRHRLALLALVRALLVAGAVLVGYFVLPLTSHLAADTFAELLFGLVVLSALLTWQVWEIVRSPYPAIQALIALALTVPMFLTLFSTAYVLMSDADPAHFSEPLSRLDGLYFTVTVFATVGFGDITAVSQTARAIVTLQMVGGLVLVGLIARVIFGAVQEGRARHAGTTTGSTDTSTEAR